MGCGASKPQITVDTEAPIQYEAGGQLPGPVEVSKEPEVLREDRIEDVKTEMLVAETEAIDWKPESSTFLGSCLQARQLCPDDVAVMEDAAVRLQAHNRRMKETIATLDASSVYEALSGGFLSNGINHRKMIITLCSRTKLQLERTHGKFRQLYDGDLRKTVKSETSGYFSDRHAQPLL